MCDLESTSLRAAAFHLSNCNSQLQNSLLMQGILRTQCNQQMGCPLCSAVPQSVYGHLQCSHRSWQPCMPLLMIAWGRAVIGWILTHAEKGNRGLSCQPG